jgi:hypothetical protein
MKVALQSLSVPEARTRSPPLQQSLRLDTAVCSVAGLAPCAARRHAGYSALRVLSSSHKTHARTHRIPHWRWDGFGRVTPSATQAPARLPPLTAGNMGIERLVARRKLLSHSPRPPPHDHARLQRHHRENRLVAKQPIKPPQLRILAKAITQLPARGARLLSPSEP